MNRHRCLQMLMATLLSAAVVQTLAEELSFSGDVEFLKKHVSVIELTGKNGQARVAVVPDFQGRVMTSTAGGARGDSYGWINYDLIAKGEIQPRINSYGGEDRFWMGPEGGQYAIFFKKGDAFTLEDWQTPAVIDTEAYDVVHQDKTSASFRKSTVLTNYSGTTFTLTIDRTVRLLDEKQARKKLGLDIPEGVSLVAYESDNRITNTGKKAWTKDGGLLSIWILGIYKPSDETTIVIPYRAGDEKKLGPRVNDAYFGKVPADRLKVGEDVVFFKGDGQYRSKIGISPARAGPACGSYDATGKMLTLVQYTLPGKADGYVNSMWELQDEPYSGDAINSYNDGPPEPGKKPLGPFYELESSSPALAVKPGKSARHVHRTYHIQGPEEALDGIAREVLGVSLDEIKGAF